MRSCSTLGVVLLAAGRSTRMGRPKLLLPWGQTTILGHLLSVWKTLGSRQIGVVLAADDSGLAGELDRLEFPKNNRIFNPTPEAGMFNSIQRAAAWSGWNPGLARWALVLGDQPHLKVPMLQGLLEFAQTRPDAVCQPARRGRPRHPVLLPKPIFSELAQTSSSDLKQFLANYQVALWECDDPGLDRDLDRPEDYHSMLTVGTMGNRPHSAP